LKIVKQGCSLAGLRAAKVAGNAYNI
jgi:hypothetical protein